MEGELDKKLATKSVESRHFPCSLLLFLTCIGLKNYQSLLPLVHCSQWVVSNCIEHHLCFLGSSPLPFLIRIIIIILDFSPIFKLFLSQPMNLTFFSQFSSLCYGGGGGGVSEWVAVWSWVAHWGSTMTPGIEILYIYLTVLLWKGSKYLKQRKTWVYFCPQRMSNLPCYYATHWKIMAGLLPMLSSSPLLKIWF